MKKGFLGLTVLLLAMLGCNLNPATSVAVPTMSTGTPEIQSSTAVVTLPTMPPTEPPAATAAPDTGSITPDGEVISVGGISFLMPNGMSSDASSNLTTEVEYPYTNPSYGDMPQHIKFILNNYAAKGIMLEPQIMVFKTTEYAQYSDLTGGIINNLESLQYADGLPLPASLDGPTFTAQIRALTFQNGHGIRYLTQVDQAPLPVNNYEMFYYFQGLTNDGQFYIQAILPAQAPFLAADDNPNTPLPSDGIPFNMDDFPGYLSAVTQRLNATDTFSFTPFLGHLDAMMESLQVTGF
ncbi:MAG: hypothetical protein K8S20_04420 [Chloroflexi bacterium]|nr:hypothetical protein [Chloroflexota bacterium]